MKFLAFLFMGFSLSANAGNLNLDLKKYPHFPAGLEDIHFFTAKSSKGIRPDFSKHQRGLLEKSSEGCREKIKNLMCLVEPANGQEKRECLPGGEVYAHHFEKLYDNYPAVLQKVFCSLDVIYIEKKFHGTAYAGSSQDGLSIMGIRQSVLDENLDLHTWASWKEQLSFGGITGAYELTPSLPEILTSQTPQVNDFLYFVIAHEFGHILDFANKVNDYKQACPEDEKDQPAEGCEMKEGSWGAISWITDRKPKAQNDFLNRTGLCFYKCQEVGKLEQSVVSQLYHDLYQTDFLSTYATAQPWDDFADSLGYYAIYHQLHKTYEIDTKQGVKYDIMKKLTSPIFEKKHQYIENFLKRTDLIYP